MTETEQLRAEIAALRHVIKRQAIDLQQKDMMLNTAMYSLRASNNMFVDERNRRTRAESLLEQYQQYNMTCAALGIMPTAQLYTEN